MRSRERSRLATSKSHRKTGVARRIFLRATPVCRALWSLPARRRVCFSPTRHSPTAGKWLSCKKGALQRRKGVSPRGGATRGGGTQGEGHPGKRRVTHGKRRVTHGNRRISPVSEQTSRHRLGDNRAGAHHLERWRTPDQQTPVDRPRPTRTSVRPAHGRRELAHVQCTSIGWPAPSQHLS